MEGYCGGTEEINLAAFTSPPTGNGAAGATGCLELVTKPDDNASPPPTVPADPRFSASSEWSWPVASLFTTGADRFTSPSFGFFGCTIVAASGASTVASFLLA